MTVPTVRWLRQERPVCSGDQGRAESALDEEALTAARRTESAAPGEYPAEGHAPEERSATRPTSKRIAGRSPRMFDRKI